VGGYFPLFAGMFYDSMKAYDWWGVVGSSRKRNGTPYLLRLCSWKAHPMTRRLGPMLTVLIGVVLQFGGYYGMWAAAVGHINPPYWVMILLAMAACNGQAWYETAGLVTSVRNFETERWVVWNAHDISERRVLGALTQLMPCGGSLASRRSSTHLNSVCCFAEQVDGA
jgi:Nodulin-like